MELNQKSLLIIIDVYKYNSRLITRDKIISDKFKNFQLYQKKILNNIKNLCIYCNKNEIDIVNADYVSNYCGRIKNYINDEFKNIKFKYTLNKHEDNVNLDKYDNIFFCGKSIDQCVVRRPYGYVGFHPCDKIPFSPFSNKKKYIVLDCCILGIPVSPIDHCINKVNFKENIDMILDNEKEVFKYKKKFCQVNNIQYVIISQLI